MVQLWFASDHHFDHRNMVEKFKLDDGSPSRPFASVEEMNEIMIERHNKVVKSNHHVYFLGDLTMHRQIGQIKYRILDRLQGHKRLLLGNHDGDKIENYLKYFEKIFASRVIDNMLFTHIPVHPESLGRFKANIHGHSHHNSYKPIMKIDQKGYGPHERKVPYINISVEKIDYRPVSLEEIQSMVEKQSR